MIVDELGGERSHTLHRDSHILERRSPLALGESWIDGGCWPPSEFFKKRSSSQISRRARTYAALSEQAQTFETNKSPGNTSHPALLSARERLCTKQNELHPLPLHRADHFCQSLGEHMVARPSQTKDALKPRLGRSVIVIAGAVLCGLIRLHVRTRRRAPIDNKLLLMQGSGKRRSRPLFLWAPSTAHQFGRVAYQKVVPAPVLLTIRPEGP